MRKTKLCLTALLFIAYAALPVRAGIHETSQTVTAGQRTTATTDSTQLYIVQFTEPPALVAQQTIQSSRNRSATSAAAFDPYADDVRQYVNLLQAKQNDILLSLNLWHKRVYSYGYTFNGVAIRLTADEADRLRQRRDVARIWEDSRRPVATNDSPRFLGLLDQQGGLRADRGLTGENIIIGVIDSGITPSHPSFRDREEQQRPPGICRSEWAENSLLGLWLCRRFNKPAKIAYNAAPANWRGACESGPGFAADSCNNKVIGARFYSQGFNAEGEVDEDEFMSPADADGHGTHIASIAAGNPVNAEIYNKSVGRISGVAPRARVAVYKACWLEPGAARASCSVADLAMAIEDAVADGVDIINYSIGDRNSSLDDPDDLALLAATEAGVLSVAATGNDGPNMMTIQSPATTPWVLSVGASSRPGSRLSQAVRVSAPASLANDYESREGGFTPPLSNNGPVNGQLILVNDGSAETEDDDEGSFFDACSEIQNADELRGNIALIQRGYCNFDVKVAFAEEAGARGVVVFNNEAELLVMDGRSELVDIPAVLIGQADGQLLRDKLLEDTVVNMTLDGALFVQVGYDANVMGSFSGRGPSFGDSDFLKPDVVAPGTAILGGHTPDVANGYRGERFQYLSGTSQAAPHVAGAAALIKQARPDWTPAELKSALMTTSRQNIVKEDGQTPATPFDMGAGHIAPNGAVDPGLLYPVAIEEYDTYLCRYGLERVSSADCQQLRSTGYQQDARDINLPSVAITELAGQVEVKRSVKNAGPAARFSVATTVPDGISLSVEPATLSLGAGETAEFTLRFTADGTGLDRWHYGSFTWVSEAHEVYSPFVVQPTLFSVPLSLRGEGPAGDLTLPVSFGYTGKYGARINGLIAPCILPDRNSADAVCINEGPARVDNANSSQYSFKDDAELPGSIRRFRINVPQADDELLRIALRDSLTAGNDDLDIYLYYCVTTTPGLPCEVLEPNLPYASFNAGTSNEQIDVEAPAPGTWIIDVHGYQTENAVGTDFRLYAWSFGSDVANGNLTLTTAPASAVSGTTVAAAITWQGLEDGLWLGSVTHYDDPGNSDDVPLGTTIIEIDNSQQHNW